tara:strand:- start:3866 stop:4063 length:198 start_codon:yes stop_codon:yes gene_type:complete
LHLKLQEKSNNILTLVCTPGKTLQTQTKTYWNFGSFQDIIAGVKKVQYLISTYQIGKRNKRKLSY